MRQLASYDALDFSEADYYRLIASKTASLMSAACEIGALVGPAHHRKALARFGHNLGMAFQIADDLLDYTGSEEETGKPSCHDLRERKVTLPLVGALERAGEAERGRVRGFFTRIDPTDEEISEIVGIVHGSGGLDYARVRALDYAGRAEACLDALPQAAATESLAAAVSYAVARTR
jgi:octaprenyl-diphosphate synthase